MFFIFIWFFTSSFVYHHNTFVPMQYFLRQRLYHMYRIRTNITQSKTRVFQTRKHKKNVHTRLNSFCCQPMTTSSYSDLFVSFNAWAVSVRLAFAFSNFFPSSPSKRDKSSSIFNRCRLGNNALDVNRSNLTLNQNPLNSHLRIKKPIHLFLYLILKLFIGSWER